MIVGYAALFVWGAVVLLLVFKLVPQRNKEPAQITILEATRFNSDSYGKHPSLTIQLLWRLNPEQGSSVLFDGFIHAQENGDKVTVFILHGNKPVILEDSRELFPSDGLITRIRLIMQ